MKTVLVVDDEFGITEVLEAALGDRGYRVLSAYNGQRGLELATSERPDLVIADVMMPLLTGPALARALSEDPATRDIPVVIMTSLRETAIAASDIAYAGYLHKPFKIAEIRALVDRLIG